MEYKTTTKLKQSTLCCRLKLSMTQFYRIKGGVGVPPSPDLKELKFYESCSQDAQVQLLYKIEAKAYVRRDSYVFYIEHVASEYAPLVLYCKVILKFSLY